MRCSTGGGRSARPARPRPPEPPRAARPGAAARGGVCGGGSLRGWCRPFHPWEASPLYYGVFRWKLPLFYRLFAGASITLLSLGGAFGDILFASSGAVAETILNLDHVLPRIPLADREGSQETIRFLAHLWVLSVRTESTRRRQDTPIHPPFLRQNTPPIACRICTDCHFSLCGLTERGDGCIIQIK